MTANDKLGFVHKSHMTERNLWNVELFHSKQMHKKGDPSSLSSWVTVDEKMPALSKRCEHRPVTCEKLAISTLDSHWVFSPSLPGMPPMASMATGLPGVSPLPLPPLPVGVSPPLVSSAPPTLPPPIANGAPPTGMIQPITGFSHPGIMDTCTNAHMYLKWYSAYKHFLILQMTWRVTFHSPGWYFYMVSCYLQVIYKDNGQIANDALKPLNQAHPAHRSSVSRWCR